jgi:hypothetical protein
METINSSNNSNTNGATGNGVSIAVKAALAAPSTTTVVSGRTVKCSIDFMTRDTDAQFVVNNGRILTAMTGNSAFPAPVPSLATLTAAQTAYVAAISQGADSKIGRSNRKKQRLALVVLMRQLAHYVEDTSAGDVTTLLTSGFVAQRTRSPIGPMPVPANVRLVRGKLSGQAIARCGRVARASAYQWRLAPATTPAAWLPTVTTFAAHNVFEGLTPMTSYVVEACAVGTAGAGDWSATATVLVL